MRGQPAAHLRDDVLRACPDCGGKNMAVIRIRQFKAVNKGFVAFDPAFGERSAHGIDLRINTVFQLRL